MFDLLQSSLVNHVTDTKVKKYTCHTIVNSVKEDFAYILL